LSATDRDEVIRELMTALATAGVITIDQVEPLSQAVLERENKGSTGFGKGVAIPHVKHQSIPKAVAAIGISEAGIDFSALDRQPVHSVVLLLSPIEAEKHLAAMNVIWPNLNNDRFRKFLRQSASRQEVVDLLDEVSAA
jgi:mannitol/fructose-specific phosphotransferase system IIA component (Ntr-type)